MEILTTERLVIREFRLADAPLVLELLNEPGFHQYIGDKGVRDIAGAEKYLSDGPLASYAQHGFGLWLVQLKEGGTPLGTCGILKRAALAHPDIGYAYLARHAGRGYAFEAAHAVLQHGHEKLGLPTIVAITARQNPRSFKLLRKLGFRQELTVQLPGYAGSSLLFMQKAAD